MRRVNVSIFVLTLLICAGCSQPASNPKVEIKIESEQTIFRTDENISVLITIKNLTSKDLPAPETYWSAFVLLDGKEYKRLAKHIGDWNGPGVIIPNGGLFQTGLTLSEYGIGPDVLTLGKHKLSVKIENDVSNVLTITMKENR